MKFGDFWFYGIRSTTFEIVSQLTFSSVIFFFEFWYWPLVLKFEKDDIGRLLLKHFLKKNRNNGSQKGGSVIFINTFSHFSNKNSIKVPLRHYDKNKVILCSIWHFYQKSKSFWLENFKFFKFSPPFIKG